MDLMFAQLDALATPAPYSSPYSPVVATSDSESNEHEIRGLSTSPSAYHEWWLNEGKQQLNTPPSKSSHLSTAMSCLEMRRV